jgi:CRP-like cAMP-binding protein
MDADRPTKPATLETLHAHYPDFAADLVNDILDCVAEARALFEGDLDRWMIVAAIAARTFQTREFKAIRIDDVLQGRIGSYPSLTTNVASLAESLGIARETARRKVAELVEMGFIERRGGGLALTPLASKRFSPVREQMLRLMLKARDIVGQVESTA